MPGIALKPRQLPRPSALSVTPDNAGVWCIRDPMGQFHRICLEGVNAVYRVSNYPKPPFLTTSIITSSASDREHRMIYDYANYLRVLFWRSGEGIYETYSKDYGVSWATPYILQSGVKHPTLATCQHTGAIVRAAYEIGAGRVRVGNPTMQFPGDDYPTSLPYVLTRTIDGLPLIVEDDTFHIASASNTGNEWLMSIRTQGQGYCGLWSSRSFGTTWEQIAQETDGSGQPRLSNCKYPTVHCNWTTGHVMRAAYKNYRIEAGVKYPGESAYEWFTFKDSTGSDLSVADSTFHIYSNWQHSDAWILSVYINGEGMVSEWESLNDGRNWTRVI